MHKKNFFYTCVKKIKKNMKLMRAICILLLRLIYPIKYSKKRILVAYDTNSQPFSVGDAILFVFCSVVLSKILGIKVVDFSLIYNSKNPEKVDPVFIGIVNSENVLSHLGKILSVAQMSQQIKSILIFDSNNQFYKYLHDNRELYHVWPSEVQMEIRDYQSPRIFNELLFRYFKKFTTIPEIECKEYLKIWAVKYIKEHCKNNIPVTVNLRFNKGWHQNRNANICSWLEFFKYCEDRYPVTFILISARDEHLSDFLECKNIVYSKDSNTTLEQDLALISGSSMHMGSSSGPATIAWFSDKPYLIFKPRSNLLDNFFIDSSMIIRNGNLEKFWFANDSQLFVINCEETSYMIDLFERIWSKIRNYDLKN